MSYTAEGVAYNDADVTGDPYATGAWQAENQTRQHISAAQQQQAFPVASAAAYGSYGSQQPHGAPTQSSYGFMPAVQPPVPPAYRQGPAHSLHTAAQCGMAPAAPPQQRYNTMPAAAAYQYPEDDSLKSARDLPVAFQPLFSYRYFNAVQSECFDVAYKTDTNMVISAPTGAGKTGVLELAMLRLLSKHLTAADQSFQPTQGGHKIIYIGPIKALVQERHNDWQTRYGSRLGLHCVQLTGDVDDDQLDDDLETADVICSTPEKFDQVTRKVKEKGKMAFFAQLGLILLDEVHLLNEAGRGSSLEAGCVGRIKAVATIPEMAKAHIASVRFVAVSATIPNIRDLATWLNVPATGIKQYGDELRPCKLTTHVKGYNPAKNDFLFERRLNDHVYGIVTGYCNGRPGLVFCNSRKGTMDTAAILAKEAAAHSNASTRSVFVKSAQQLQRLQAASSQAKAKGLGAVLVAGVGFHNAAMEPEDRELVESLFKANDLPVLCTTSTLAMGVNLPAHLVVIKGTTRYVGDSETAPGETTGYKEYTQTEVLQMVGRAGRPQFDNEGVAVIMTSKDNTHRYQRMMTGQPVESCLMANLAEHLNAELVLGTIQDVPMAIQWIKSSFLYTRVRTNPSHYGLAHKLKPGMSQAELDGVLKSQLIMQPVSQLLEYGLATTDEDSYSLAATKAGKLMANHFLKLRTMASIVKLGQQPNMPSLLRVICGAEEFRNASLRRCERKVLNDINHATDPQQLRYHVMATRDDGTATGKLKERLTSPQEKLFVLLNDALADKPCETLDYSLKQEQERLLLVGQRIAKCMARYYIERNSFSAAGRSLLLARSLRAKLWDDSKVAVRQVHGVGKLLAARLSAAGLGSLKSLMACKYAHQIEVAAQKPYPWGSELLSNLRSLMPPPVRMELQVLKTLPNRALSCSFTLTRLDSAQTVAAVSPASTGGNAAGRQTAISNWARPMCNESAAAVGAGGLDSNTKVNKIYQTHTPCKLLCGCSNTDQLLLMRNVVLETFESPMQLTFLVDPPADPNQPINISARLVLDRVVGLDDKASITVLPAAGRRQQQQLGTDATAAAEEADPEDDVGEADTQATHSRLAALAAVRSKQRSKRPVSSLADNQQEQQENAVPPGSPAATARSKQPCKANRQRENNVTAQVQQDRLGQQQLARQWMGAGPGSSFAVSGAHVPDMYVQRDTAHGTAEQASVVREQPAPAPLSRPAPQTAIAARYNRFLGPVAAASHPSVRQPTAGAAAGGAGDTAEHAPSEGPAADVAAVDAGGLEFTPEHQRQLQQLASQQSVHDSQHVSQQLAAARQQQRDLGAMADSRCAASQRQETKAADQDNSQQQQQYGDERPASPCFDLGDGGFSIAAMFDMLADDDCESPERPETRQLQQQELGTSNQVVEPARLAPRTTAPGAPKAAAAAPTPASTTRDYADQTTLSAATAAGGVFGTAVLQSRASSSSLLHSFPGGSIATAARGTVGSTLLQWQQWGMKSKPVGLGAQRMGAAASHASSSTGAPNLAHRQMPVPQQQHVSKPQRALEQRQYLQRQLSASMSSVHTYKQEAEMSCAAPEQATAAVDVEQAEPNDMFTPPRQIVRSGHSAGLLHSADSAGRGISIQPGHQPQQLQVHWTQHHAANAQVLRLEQDSMECSADDDWQEPTAPPSLQQFAFAGSTAGQGPLPAAYRPSQNAMMFQRSQQRPTGPAASNRVLAQAKLTAGGGTCTSSSSSLSVQRRQQQGGYRQASMTPRPTGIYMGSMSLSQSGYSQQQQRCPPVVSMQPPAAPKVQWGGFVDEAQQQDRLQAAKQARATWRATADGPATQHLVMSTPHLRQQGAGASASGMLHQLRPDDPDLPSSFHSGSSTLTVSYAPHQADARMYMASEPAPPQPQVQAAVAAASVRGQPASTGMPVAAANGPVTDSTVNAEVNPAAGDAEQAVDDEDGGCVDFGGIFDFMKC